MPSEERIKKAKSSISGYLEDGLLKKEMNETAMQMYVKNSDNSLRISESISGSSDYDPSLWVVVISYYSMFYISAAVLLHMGYKIGDKMSHTVVEDCLYALVMPKLEKKNAGRL